MMRWIVFWVILAMPAEAAERQLSGPEIKSVLDDVSLYAGAPGEIEQIFQKAGLTFYLVNGSAAQGEWKVEGDQYCSQWPPSPTWSCFDFLADGDGVFTFVGTDKKRYQMRTVK
jgi:hypothetical protein